MASESSRKSPRIVELDALRALAAINLMLFHYTHVYSVKYGYTAPLGFEFPWGKYGVQLFFMLSGLVNAMTILKKGDAGSFLASRCLRILPCYYIVIALNILLMCLMPLSAAFSWSWPQLWANLTVMPNLFGYECFEPVMWTLQVEVLFYGILIMLFARGWLEKPLPTMVAGLTICVLGCWGIDRLSTQLSPESATLGMLLFARQLLLLDYFPLFAVGILLHDIWRRVQSGKYAAPAIETTYTQAGNSLGIIAALVAFHCIDHHGHNPWVSVGLTTLLGLALFRRIPLLGCQPLVFISGISYMLYLLHDNLGSVMIYWMNRTLGLPPVLSFAIAIPAAIALAIVTTFALERPLTSYLRQRWLFRKPKVEANKSSPTSVPQGVVS